MRLLAAEGAEAKMGAPCGARRRGMSRAASPGQLRFFSELLRGTMGCVRPEMNCNASSVGPRPGDENRVVVACVLQSRGRGKGGSCAPRVRRGMLF